MLHLHRVRSDLQAVTLVLPVADLTLQAMSLQVVMLVLPAANLTLQAVMLVFPAADLTLQVVTLVLPVADLTLQVVTLQAMLLQVVMLFLTVTDLTLQVVTLVLPAADLMLQAVSLQVVKLVLPAADLGCLVCIHAVLFLLRFSRGYGPTSNAPLFDFHCDACGIENGIHQNWLLLFRKSLTGVHYIQPCMLGALEWECVTFIELLLLVH